MAPDSRDRLPHRDRGRLGARRVASVDRTLGLGERQREHGPPERAPRLPFTHTPIILATALALGCADGAVAPTAESDGPTLQASVTSRVLHRATGGTPDICAALGATPGCDANFSLVALQRVDSSVTGQWHDQFARFPGFGGQGIHVTINCLLVIGNQAWVGGVVTASCIPGAVGLDVLTTVLDTGTSRKDPPDLISLSFLGFPNACLTAPGLPLIPTPQGQVVVEG